MSRRFNRSELVEGRGIGLQAPLPHEVDDNTWSHVEALHRKWELLHLVVEVDVDGLFASDDMGHNAYAMGVVNIVTQPDRPEVA